MKRFLFVMLLIYVICVIGNILFSIRYYRQDTVRTGQLKFSDYLEYEEEDIYVYFIPFRHMITLGKFIIDYILEKCKNIIIRH